MTKIVKKEPDIYELFWQVTEVLRPRIWRELAVNLGYDVSSTTQKRKDFDRNFYICMLILWSPWLLYTGIFLHELFTV